MNDLKPRPRLPPNQQLVEKEKWPIIGERQSAEHPPETLAIRGLVDQSTVWTLPALSQLPQTHLELDIHCVTRWSKYDLRFSGVLLRDLLEVARVQKKARFVSFVAHSTRRHSTSLPIEMALELRTLIATQVGGVPLPVEHGGPIRNIVPDRYFYKSVKWLREIEVLAEDRLGYWEAESGYHNSADPWLEQRYLAPSLDRRMAGKLISSRDFSGRDLRSIDASHRDLTGLRAIKAGLRDADFRRSSLRDANFTGANLSNAHFELADLRGACFLDADLEGANFSGADLRQSDFSNASLFGASFWGASEKDILAATLDGTTQMSPNCLLALTPEQLEFVQSRQEPG